MASRIGALPELVPEEGLVAPGDAEALAAAVAARWGSVPAGEEGLARVRDRASPDAAAAALRGALRFALPPFGAPAVAFRAVILVRQIVLIAILGAFAFALGDFVSDPNAGEAVSLGLVLAGLMVFGGRWASRQAKRYRKEPGRQGDTETGRPGDTERTPPPRAARPPAPRPAPPTPAPAPAPTPQLERILTPAPSGSGAVDLNAAGVEELVTLPGVGRGAARRIVAEREAGGPFGSVWDLERVDGFDRSRIGRIEPLARV